jgi:hypothetical protein
VLRYVGNDQVLLFGALAELQIPCGYAVDVAAAEIRVRQIGINQYRTVKVAFVRFASSKNEWRKLGEANEIVSLRKLLDTLNTEIINKLEALNNLRESSDYELYQRCHRQSGLLDEVGADLAKGISAEIARLETEAEKLKGEIAELIGTDETLMV